MAGQFTLYSAIKGDMKFKDLGTATIKFALLSSAYTPNTDTTGDSVWADISASEIADGNGYTAGGLSPSNGQVVDITNGFKYMTDNVVITPSGGPVPAFSLVVMYVEGTLWGLTNPLVGYFYGDASQIEVPATNPGSLITLVCPADGWLDVT